MTKRVIALVSLIAYITGATGCATIRVAGTSQGGMPAPDELTRFPPSYYYDQQLSDERLAEISAAYRAEAAGITDPRVLDLVGWALFLVGVAATAFATVTLDELDPFISSERLALIGAIGQVGGVTILLTDQQRRQERAQYELWAELIDNYKETRYK